MLQYIADSLDGLSADVREHYTEREGRYYLELDDKADQRVQGLIRNKNEALAEKDKLQRRIKELEASKGDSDASTERIAELEKAIKDATKAGKYSDDQVAQIKRDMESEYKTRLEEKEKELTTIRDSVRTAQREAAIKDALSSAGARKGAVGMLASFLKDRVEAVEGDTGAISIRVKKADGSGYEVSTKDGYDSVFKTVKEYVEELKVLPDYGFAFEGSKASGGGAEATVGQGNTGALNGIRSRADLTTPKAKSAYLEALKVKHNGDETAAQSEYFSLPATRPA